MKLGLSQIRELAVLISYQQEFNPQLSLESAFKHILQNHKKLGQKVNFEELTEEEFIEYENHAIKLKDSIEHISTKNHFDKLPDVTEDVTVPAYLRTLVEGVKANRFEIDQMIDNHIHGNWSVQRLELVNLQILRIAVFELLFTDKETVPRVVAVNEAIELAKLYSDDRARKFINGILSNILAELKANEDTNDEHKTNVSAENMVE
ncbi:transcription antitermination factor NusB [Aerococcus urinaeequi]|uniref:Transcription antitermination protein NusB n=1 Tax=Aerococcus viridans TaxID=1377 RepID=A0A2N6UEF4_9LACT|nr:MULTISPECIES: transcription antitermination factor NusB [Aerococcus]OFU48801.1 transcription antitermination factor NusB [Aerococcus sp. HMSC10H05]PMC79989.1 transcription antitermination factor NusB [Aerococcus viridans]